MAIRKPQMVDGWTRAWRWLSVQVGIVGIVYSQLPETTQSNFLAWLGVTPADVPGMLGALMIAARVISQQPKEGA